MHWNNDTRLPLPPLCTTTTSLAPSSLPTSLTQLDSQDLLNTPTSCSPAGKSPSAWPHGFCAPAFWLPSGFHGTCSHICPVFKSTELGTVVQLQSQKCWTERRDCSSGPCFSCDLLMESSMWLDTFTFSCASGPQTSLCKAASPTVCAQLLLYNCIDLVQLPLQDLTAWGSCQAFNSCPLPCWFQEIENKHPVTHLIWKSFTIAVEIEKNRGDMLQANVQITSHKTNFSFFTHGSSSFYWATLRKQAFVA